MGWEMVERRIVSNRRWKASYDSTVADVDGRGSGSLLEADTRSSL